MSATERHICDCGDCAQAPWVDRCKYEAENERLREALTRVGRFADDANTAAIT